MYKKILLCLDNSDHANAGVTLGVDMARTAGAALIGCHVYAARLHNMRFRQMESGLPPQYQKEEELKRQREVHDTLITKGLRIISDSYVAVLHAAASAAGLSATGISREGKNYEELLLEASEGRYDLVVMGALGLGRVPESRVGSVCERVVRRLKTDVLVAKEAAPGGSIIAAIDGSPASFGGLLSAVFLSKAFNLKVEAVSAYDPDFHYNAFRSIAGTLSDEAGKVFRFREQEKLHEEVIDKGLAKIYRGHLDTASEIAEGAGVKIKTRLLSGKPYAEIIRYVKETSPFMLVMGRTGFHSAPGLDIGSNTENCLREAACHILISSRSFTPEPKRDSAPASLSWTEGALSILERIPPFARGIAKNMIEEAARKRGLTGITEAFVIEVRKRFEG